MESLGTALLLIVLIIGIITVLAKNLSGIIFIVLALFGMYYLPYWKLGKLKDETYGTYENPAHQTLIINHNDTYMLLKDTTVVESSSVTFSDVDVFAVRLEGSADSKQFTINAKGDLVNTTDPKDVFQKMK